MNTDYSISLQQWQGLYETCHFTVEDFREASARVAAHGTLTRLEKHRRLTAMANVLEKYTDETAPAVLREIRASAKNFER